MEYYAYAHIRAMLKCPGASDVHTSQNNHRHSLCNQVHDQLLSLSIDKSLNPHFQALYMCVHEEYFHFADTIANRQNDTLRTDISLSVPYMLLL